MNEIAKRIELIPIGRDAVRGIIASTFTSHS